MYTVHKLSIAAVVFALTVSATLALAGDQTISSNTVWSGTVTVDGTVTVNSNASLTVQPGTTVNFVGTGNIKFSNAGTFMAQGTAAAPIQFTGSQSGQFTGNMVGMTLSNCIVSGMAPVVGGARDRWLYVTAGSGGFSMTSSSVTNSGGWFSSASGSTTISGCDIHDVKELDAWGYGKPVSFQHNTLQNSMLYTSSGTSLIAHNNMINSTVWAGASGGSGVYSNFVIEDNYIHNTIHGQQYGIMHTKGEIRDNIIRGCTWSMSDVGGHIDGNVLESFTPSEVTQNGDPTHENICGGQSNVVIERNLFLNNCYGSILGLGSTLLSGATIRNNTFDGRGGTVPQVSLNHLPTGAKPSNINVRDNLFLRGGRAYDEQNAMNPGTYADTLSYIDYNCWAGTNVSDGRPGTSNRFSGIQLTGKVEGDDGFGMHDVQLTRGAAFDPSTLVNNASFVDPYSDADMLAGTYTNAQLLALYRQAYTPVAGSALINAGKPTDASDPGVTYGAVDIGAVEVALLAGDADLNRVTDFKDYIVLERNFGKTSATWAMGDFDGNAVVDFKDYIILEGSFGKSVPEPMTLVLLAIGGLAMLRRKSTLG